LEWNELGHWRGRDFADWFKGGMARELEEEIGYKVDPSQFEFLGFARELGRAGKPQLFFFLDIRDMSVAELKSMFHTYTSPESEFAGLETISMEDARKLVSSDATVVHEVAGTSDVSDELRFNLALALEFLAANPNA
jgi:hypothetical protein